jgi:hypothetical protein
MMLNFQVMSVFYPSQNLQLKKERKTIYLKIIDTMFPPFQQGVWTFLIFDLFLIPPYESKNQIWFFDFSHTNQKNQKSSHPLLFSPNLTLSKNSFVPTQPPYSLKRQSCNRRQNNFSEGKSWMMIIYADIWNNPISVEISLHK